MRRIFSMAVFTCAVSVTSAWLVVASASAAVPLSGVVSPTPVAWTPNIMAGTTSAAACEQWFGGSCGNAGVLSTVIVNGEVVVAGAFTEACQPGPASSGHCKPGTLVTRDDIFAYQPGTGAIDPSFAPRLDAGPVYSVAAGPNDTVYVGGSFKTVNGAAHHQGIVQLQVTPGDAATDGQIVGAFTATVSGTVRRIEVSGNAAYLGGQFTSADSTKVTDLVRVNATTGALDSAFTMTLSNPANSLPLKVEAMSLSPDGGILAIGGTFLAVNGQSRPRVALISTGGGIGSTATLANWAAPIFANSCSNQHDYVRGIDFSPDGSFFVVADTGYKSSPRSAPGICDAAARFPANVSSTDVQPTWVNYTGGDSFYSVQVTGGVAYLGGHNRWVNNECGNNAPCEANAVLTMGFSAVDSNTGLGLPWFHPLTLRGQGVKWLTAFPAGLFSGPGSEGGILLDDGVTLNGGGAYHSFSALFPLTSTSPSPAFGPIPAGMFAQGRLGGSDESGAGVAAMCVDDAGDSATPGNPVEFVTCSNAAEQNWASQANGTITINGLCLDTAGEKTASGTKVDVNTCGSSATQVWTQGSGNTLVNKAASMCLDDPGSATKSGTPLDIATCTGGANQVWPLPAAPAPASLVPVGPVFSSALQSNSQPACLNDTGTKPGSAATTYTCFGNTSENASIQANGTIEINGLCLDTAGQAKSAGTHVVLNTCGTSATQVWTPGTGHVLVDKAAGLCLSAATGQNGGALTIATCSSASKLQKWWLPAI